MLLGPRAAILIWWLFRPVYFSSIFNTWIWPLLGLIFVPWTLLMYAIIGYDGIAGFDWVWLGLALFFDIASHTGGAYGNKDRFSGLSA